MSKFIELTKITGYSVIINIDKIVSIWAVNESTIIDFSVIPQECYHEIKESYEEVKRMILEASEDDEDFMRSYKMVINYVD